MSKVLCDSCGGSGEYPCQDHDPPFAFEWRLCEGCYGTGLKQVRSIDKDAAEKAKRALEAAIAAIEEFYESE